MARILVDMNLSTEWISLLQAAGHQAVHWSDVGRSARTGYGPDGVGCCQQLRRFHP
jgi:hypothetical protein